MLIVGSQQGLRAERSYLIVWSSLSKVVSSWQPDDRLTTIENTQWPGAEERMLQ